MKTITIQIDDIDNTLKLFKFGQERAIAEKDEQMLRRFDALIEQLERKKRDIENGTAYRNDILSQIADKIQDKAERGGNGHTDQNLIVVSDSIREVLKQWL